MFYVNINDVDVWRLMEGPILRYDVNITYSTRPLLNEQLYFADNPFAIKTTDIERVIAKLCSLHIRLKHEHRHRCEVRLVFVVKEQIPSNQLDRLFEFLQTYECIWQIMCDCGISAPAASSYLNKLSPLLEKHTRSQLILCLPYQNVKLTQEIFLRLLTLPLQTLFLSTTEDILEQNLEIRACRFNPEHYCGIAAILRAKPKVEVTLVPMVDWDESMLQLFDPKIIFRVKVINDDFIDERQNLSTRIVKHPEQFADLLPTRIQCYGLLGFCLMYEKAAVFVKQQLCEALDNYMRSFAYLHYQLRIVASNTNVDLATKLLLNQYKSHVDNLLHLKQHERYMLSDHVSMRDKLNLMNYKTRFSIAECMHEISSAYVFHNWRNLMRFQIKRFSLQDQTRLDPQKKRVPNVLL